ncbi:MAG: hypothetical protein EOP47_00440 [Sphingobacteriaceae bacterium]|nr:MAG: hypothetical protein EOP47_00440 [Sphingobacteriaceae bacterium]
MRNTLATLICCTGLMLICITGRAQTITLKAPPANIVIDGNNKEWGDMSYHNSDNNLHYTISNDKDNLYLVIKTNDERQLNNILLSGVTFSIDTKGRKKTTYEVTFPVKGLLSTKNSSFKTLEEKRVVAKATQLRKIAIDGFKDIDEDQLHIANTYKIQTALNFDDNGYLIYEEAIPLALFKAEGLANSEWAYNIKLNAVTTIMLPNSQATIGNVTVKTAVVAVPAGSGPPTSASIQAAMNNSSYSANAASSAFNNIPAREVEIVKASDFWGKFSLAK